MLSMFFSGCIPDMGSMTGMTAVVTDPSLPTIRGIRTIVDKTGVGFEWQPVRDKRVEGIEIYRADLDGGTKKYVKIATLANRFATHYVDTTVQANRNYAYTFKTFGILFGSVQGEVIRVKTLPPLSAVGFVQVFQPAPGIVKILWSPHPDARIHDYLIERRLKGREWKYLATVRGRLSPEYIDKSPAKGRRYDYRVIARTADGIRALPGRAVGLTVR
jgi:fibronectin type 3 domain-containing protein